MDEPSTPPQGTAVVTVAAKQLFDIAVALNSLAVSLSALASGNEPDEARRLTEIRRLLTDAEILVHDARRGVWDLIQERSD